MDAPLSIADDLVPGYSYALSGDAVVLPLSLRANSDPDHQCDAWGSVAGLPVAPLFLDCALTFMFNDGRSFEAFLIVETDLIDHAITEVYLLPLATPATGEEFTLINIDVSPERSRFAGCSALPTAAAAALSLWPTTFRH